MFGDYNNATISDKTPGQIRREEEAHASAAVANWGNEDLCVYLGRDELKNKYLSKLTEAEMILLKKAIKSKRLQLKHKNGEQNEARTKLNLAASIVNSELKRQYYDAALQRYLARQANQQLLSQRRCPFQPAPSQPPQSAYAANQYTNGFFNSFTATGGGFQQELSQKYGQSESRPFQPNAQSVPSQPFQPTQPVRDEKQSEQYRQDIIDLFSQTDLKFAKAMYEQENFPKQKLFEILYEESFSQYKKSCFSSGISVPVFKKYFLKKTLFSSLSMDMFRWLVETAQQEKSDYGHVLYANLLCCKSDEKNKKLDILEKSGFLLKDFQEKFGFNLFYFFVYFCPVVIKTARADELERIFEALLEKTTAIKELNIRFIMDESLKKDADHFHLDPKSLFGSAFLKALLKKQAGNDPFSTDEVKFVLESKKDKPGWLSGKVHIAESKQENSSCPYGQAGLLDVMKLLEALQCDFSAQHFSISKRIPSVDNYLEYFLARGYFPGEVVKSGGLPDDINKILQEKYYPIFEFLKNKNIDLSSAYKKSNEKYLTLQKRATQKNKGAKFYLLETLRLYIEAHASQKESFFSFPVHRSYFFSSGTSMKRKADNEPEGYLPSLKK